MVEISHPAVRGQLCAFVAVGRGLGLACAGLLTFGLGSTLQGVGWRIVHIWCGGGGGERGPGRAGRCPPAAALAFFPRLAHASRPGAPPRGPRPSCPLQALPAAPLAAAPLCSRRSLWPALLILACVVAMPESPASLIERGKVAEGRDALHQIRGPWWVAARRGVGAARRAGGPLGRQGVADAARPGGPRRRLRSRLAATSGPPLGNPPPTPPPASNRHPDIESEVGALISNADLTRAPVLRSLHHLGQRQNLPPLLTCAGLAMANAWSGGLE
jgi:hypothetical protein